MKKLTVFLLFFTLIHCNKSGNSHEVAVPAQSIISMKEEAPPPPANEEYQLQDKASTVSSTSEEDHHNVKADTISKKIIKNGEMLIQVGDINKSQDQVNDIIKKNKAYIQREDFHNTDTEENLNITIRVPHRNFDSLINSFSDGIGSVISKNVFTDDVTEEYTDISIKLANKKIYLEKYRNMLKSAATTKDILEIQENIRELEDEIDISEGRLRFIDDRVNYSTLNLGLHKEKVRSSTTSKIGFKSRFGDSVTEGWNSFVSFLLGVISLWPFFLLIPAIIFLWRKWKNRKKK